METYWKQEKQKIENRKKEKQNVVVPAVRKQSNQNEHLAFRIHGSINPQTIPQKKRDHRKNRKRRRSAIQKRKTIVFKGGIKKRKKIMPIALKPGTEEINRVFVP